MSEVGSETEFIEQSETHEATMACKHECGGSSGVVVFKVSVGVSTLGGEEAIVKGKERRKGGVAAVGLEWGENLWLVK